MSSQSPRYTKAVLAVLLGAVVGAIVIGPATGWTYEFLYGPQGLRSLLFVIIGGSVGAFIGGAGASWIAFRHDDRRARAAGALTVLLAGPALFFVLWSVLEPLELDFLPPQLALAVSLVIVAVAGRWLAIKRSDTGGP